MPRFFIDSVPGDSAVITDEDAAHISRSLRMKEGERLVLCDGRGTDYFCRIQEFVNGNVHVTVENSERSKSEPEMRITLFQGLPKGDKMDFIVQKAVELGVHEIVPVLTARCVARPDAGAAKKKCERWQKIAHEAAKQSGRGVIPAVHAVCSLQEAAQKAKELETSLVFYEGGGGRIAEHIHEGMQSAAIFIGPEGGFEEAEVEYLSGHDSKRATLGPRILRTETAPIAAISVILFICGSI